MHTMFTRFVKLIKCYLKNIANDWGNTQIITTFLLYAHRSSWNKMCYNCCRYAESMICCAPFLAKLKPRPLFYHLALFITLRLECNCQSPK